MLKSHGFDVVNEIAWLAAEFACVPAADHQHNRRAQAAQHRDEDAPPRRQAHGGDRQLMRVVREAPLQPDKPQPHE